jgi:hypothetical protein
LLGHVQGRIRGSRTPNRAGSVEADYADYMAAAGGSHSRQSGMRIFWGGSAVRTVVNIFVCIAPFILRSDGKFGRAGARQRQDRGFTAARGQGDLEVGARRLPHVARDILTHDVGLVLLCRSHQQSGYGGRRTPVHHALTTSGSSCCAVFTNNQRCTHAAPPRTHDVGLVLLCRFRQQSALDATRRTFLCT